MVVSVWFGELPISLHFFLAFFLFVLGSKGSFLGQALLGRFSSQAWKEQALKFLGREAGPSSGAREVCLILKVSFRTFWWE